MSFNFFFDFFFTCSARRSGLKPAELDFVELVGGGTRVPRLQAVLSETLGGKSLDRHLDADEAVREK